MLLTIAIITAGFAPPTFSAPRMALRCRVPTMSAQTFKRAASILGGETVTEREVVNVIGRWSKTSDWNDIGLAAELDQIIAEADGNSTALRLRPKVGKIDQQRTPERREMLVRMGQVQRVFFVENVPMLPFTDAAMAASVGATAQELNAEPLSQLALDVVFDALTASKSTFANKEEADARRSTYTRPDGSFDAMALEADLGQGRFNIFAFGAVFYGTPNLIGLALGIKLGYFDALGDVFAGSGSPIDLGGVLGSPLLWAGLTEPLLGRTPEGLPVPNLPGLAAYVGLFATLFVIFRPQIISRTDRQASPLQDLLEKD